MIRKTIQKLIKCLNRLNSLNPKFIEHPSTGHGPRPLCLACSHACSAEPRRRRSPSRDGSRRRSKRASSSHGRLPASHLPRPAEALTRAPQSRIRPRSSPTPQPPPPPPPPAGCSTQRPARPRSHGTPLLRATASAEASSTRWTLPLGCTAPGCRSRKPRSRPCWAPTPAGGGSARGHRFTVK